MLDVNLVGMVQMLQAFLPDMKRRRSGRILVTGSMGGLMGEWGERRGAGPGTRRPSGLSLEALPSEPQRPRLPAQGCPSTLFTVPASSPSKVYARAWPCCCPASGSSESPPTL